MTFTNGTFTSPVDGLALATYAWETLPEGATAKGVVQIAHGLAEHSERYDRLATALNEAGYLVYAIDHRGHGASIAGAPGDFGDAGFDGLITDLGAYGAQLAADHQDLPLYLIAHSMGSFAAQAALLDVSDQYAGVVLSGSTALDVLAGALAENPGGAGLEAFNVGFEHRTGYEWLSRDEAEVDKYVADPLCGFDLPEDAVPALFAPAARVSDPENLARINSGLPILVTSGSADPLAGGGQLVGLLAQRYTEAGVRDVTLTVYPEARHEIFNETNREEVTGDVIAWIDAH